MGKPAEQHTNTQLALCLKQQKHHSKHNTSEMLFLLTTQKQMNNFIYFLTITYFPFRQPLIIS